jgi:putative DNA primase/helicase
LGDLSHALRWHKGVGAIIAKMTDAMTNKATGVHRTFLNKDSSKRERKMLGKQGVIRLSPDEDVTHGLGVSEGVEDGVAVLLSPWAPVWVATSAIGIEKFPVIPGIECLTVHADLGDVGTRSALACLTRWKAAGKEAVISIPSFHQRKLVG